MKQESTRRFNCKGVWYFHGYLTNGFRFHTLELQKNRMYQNSVVMVKGIGGDKEQDYFGHNWITIFEGKATDIVSLWLVRYSEDW